VSWSQKQCVPRHEKRVRQWHLESNEMKKDAGVRRVSVEQIGGLRFWLHRSETICPCWGPALTVCSTVSRELERIKSSFGESRK